MQNDDWQDSFDGNVSNLGVSPYGFDGSPNNRIGQSQSQQQQGGASPLAGLAQALMKYGNNGMTVDTGNPGGSLGTVQTPDFNYTPSYQPTYTPPLD